MDGNCTLMQLSLRILNRQRRWQVFQNTLRLGDQKFECRDKPAVLLLGPTGAEDGNDVLIDNFAQQIVWVGKDSVVCLLDRETLLVEKMKILYRDGDGSLIICKADPV